MTFFDEGSCQETTSETCTDYLLLIGASLAQDRGRMEARIEALTAEVSELKKECQVSITTVTASENTPPFLSHESRSPPYKKKKKIRSV